MAEAQADDGEIFVYTGDNQVVPQNVRRVRIDKSITIILRRAFEYREHLIDVEFHDGIEIIEAEAFYGCTGLVGRIRLLGVKIVGEGAFANCSGLIEIEFGDKLETIEQYVFFDCKSLRSITMPSVRNIERCAFDGCEELTDLELPELETIGQRAFQCCHRLRRITIPLNCMIGADLFAFCPRLATVALVGEIHKTVASLHLESWRNQMMDEMNRINQILPPIGGGKTAAVQQWIRSVISQLDHYKAEHRSLLKEATTLLELAVWKANLDDNEGGVIEKEGVRTTRGRRKRAGKRSVLHLAQVL